jgi:hypothetical protein
LFPHDLFHDEDGMQRDEVINLLGKFPLQDIPRVVVVLKNGTALNIETLFRCEPNFLVFRGRESGTNDGGRGFFVPYSEILFVKLERIVQIKDFQDMFGGGPEGAAEDNPFADTITPAPKPADPAEQDAPVENLDPASIAKQNLLERIRAARTSAGLPKTGGN